VPDTLLTGVIRRVVDRHHRCLIEHGVECIEELLDADDWLRLRMGVQRKNVERTLTGCSPEQHVEQLEALLRGIELVEGRL